MSRPPRIHGFDYIGRHQYFLTSCTRDRCRAFEDPAAVTATLHAIRTAGAETEVALLAYCFMPDHVHLLAEGMTDRADARAFMILAKKRSGIAYSRRTHKPLWQEGYYDRVLRAGDDVRAVARYMLNNPVRAGLVRHPFEYPHLGSDRWSLVELVEAIS